MRAARAVSRRVHGAALALSVALALVLIAAPSPSTGDARAAALGVHAAFALQADGSGGSAPDASLAATPTEYEVKAVFVLNFSRFVAWPAQAFTSPRQPFVIGVLGDDPFGAHLDEAVRNEEAGGHPLVVRRFQDIADVRDCQILFIDQSESADLPRILAALDHRSTLTVTDVDGASQRGVMIQFTTVNHQIRLRINDDSARAAGLTISATLLRLAKIDRTRGN
jgi:YfiR/HmsC-like